MNIFHHSSAWIAKHKRMPARVLGHAGHHHLALATLALVVAGAGVYTYRHEFAQAATFTFTQSTATSGWGGGISATTAAHATDQTNWTKYSATSTNMVASGSGVSLSATSKSVADDGIGVQSIDSVASVSEGTNSTCAVKTDGTLYCWGYNNNGQLGDNTAVNKSTPVQVHGVGNSGLLTGVSSVSVSSDSTVFAFTCAVKTDGTVYCWGANNHGQLGDNTAVNKSTPVQVHGVGNSGLLTGVASVSAGYYSTCAVKTDGTLYCWGYNSNSQLGDNTITQRITPVQVLGVGGTGNLTSVASVSVGALASTCAVKTDGTVYCWGYNNAGGLGDNTTTQRATPVQVLGVGGTGNLTGVASVSAGASSACAVKTDGTLYCWGRNTQGALGDNTTTQRNTPVQVLGVGGTGNLTGVASVSEGTNSTCAVKTDGTVYCWGYNLYGQLGDNTTVQKTTPVQVLGVGGTGNLTSVASVSEGTYSTCAVKTDGTLYCWGYSQYGQLGDNTTTQRNTPVRVANGKGFESGTYSSTMQSGTSTAASVGLGVNWLATGGATSTSSGGYAIHKFTANGNFVLNTPVNVEYLAVGGGGGSGGVAVNGGTFYGGGGGAGGMTTGTFANLSAATYPVTIGAGGGNNTSGGNSIFASSTGALVTAYGGGHGSATTTSPAVSGGSGAGGGGLSSDVSNAGALGTSGQGNSGAAGLSNGNNGGGGGGAGGAGNTNGTGGVGLASSISGASVTYAKGGTGGSYGNSGANSSANTGDGGGGSTYSGGSGVVIVRYVNYASSGTFTSAVINLGSKIPSSPAPTLSWTSTVPGGANPITMEVQTSADNVTWSGYSAITSGGSITVPGAGVQYVQYKATLTTSDPTVTPTLDSVTINYSQYASSGNLISSKYDSGSSANLVSNISWAASNTDVDETVKFQVRSASTSALLDTAPWCGQADCSGSTYFTTSGTLNATLNAATGDHRWFQYKVFLTSGGDITPTLTSFSVQYVVNDAPVITNVSSSQITNTADANFGKIVTTYNIADDTNTSATTTLQYCTTGSCTEGNSAGWVTATTVSGDVGVGTVLDNGKSITWSPTIDYPAHYNLNTQLVRIKADDGEGANNLGYGMSASPFTLDTSAPVISNITPLQITDSNSADFGKIITTYDIADTSTLSVNVVLQYCTTGGTCTVDSDTGWWPATTVSGNVGAGVAVAAGKSITWTPSADYLSHYSASQKMRIKANDGNAPSNLGYGISGVFTLDTTAPAVTSASFDSTQDVVSLTATDGSAIEYRLCNAACASEAWLPITTNVATSTSWSPAGFGAGAETVYLQVRDLYGNVTDSTIIAPATPTNFLNADTSNPAANSFGETLSWLLVPGATSYNVYYATTSSATDPAPSAYTLLSALGNTNVYPHNITTATTSAYWYKVAALGGGSISNFATLAGDVPDSFGTALPDTAPPTISTPATSAILSTSLLVTFITNELATSTVTYYTGASQGANCTGTNQTTTSFATAQSVPLTGLTPATTYGFCVKATDTSGNVSGGVDGGSFTTADVPFITAVASSTTANTATITWNTASTSDSYVYYSASPSFTNPISVGSATLIANPHQILISGLTTGVTYYFSLKSTDGNSNVATDTNGGSYYSFTTTTDTQAPLFIGAPSPSVSSTTAVIVWQTDEPATSQVLYSATTGDYSRFTATDSVKSIYHVVTLSSATANGGIAGGTNELTPSSVYYYIVKSADASGNMATSNEYLFTAESGADTMPPSITNITVPVGTLKSTTATVTFTTDELATAQVLYGTTVSSDCTYTVNASNTSYSSTTQSVVLSGLTPNTTYYFCVNATDVVGNASVSVSGGNFTTTGGPIITNIDANTTDNTATVFWDTSTSSDSYVYYSTNSSLANPLNAGSAMMVSAQSAGVYHHQVDISRLTAGTKYYYSVKSTDGNGNPTLDTNNGTYYYFLTTIDTTPPVITGISTPVLAPDAAVVVWQTNEPATAQVQWGTASSTYTHSTVLDSTKSIYHVATLSSGTVDMMSNPQTLTPETTYHFKVLSNDVAGNPAESADQSFTTPKTGDVTITVVNVVNSASAGDTMKDTIPPTVSDVKVSDITPFGATVKFGTSEDANAFVKYGKDVSYGDAAGDDTWGTTHTVKLHGLTLGTEYHLKVASQDKAGNTGTSADQTFKTTFLSENLKDMANVENIEQFQKEIESAIESILPSLVPPFVSKPIVSDITESGATISFKTNIKAFPVVVYAEDGAYDETKDNPYTGEVSDTVTKDVSHTLALTGLKGNTKYHIQARAFSLPKVIGKSADVTFITKASKIAGSIVERKKDSFTVVWTTEEPTSSMVEFKNLKTGFTERKVDDAKKTSHSMKVENLPSGTTYEVNLSGMTEQGNIAEAGSPLSVTTSTDTTAPTISGFKVDNALVPGRTDRIQTIVSWTTDEPSNSTVYFEEGAGTAGETKELTNKSEALDSYTTNHSTILPSLKPGTIYRLKVTSSDDSGNLGSFGPRTVITPKQTESITDIIFKNFEDSFKFMRKM